MTAFCHCADCQKQSGGAFSVNVLVPNDQIEIAGKTLTQYEITGTSGQKVTRNFCNRCGSPLTTVLDAFGGLAAIKAGTLDDSSWVKPGIEIWCDSAQPWGVVGDGLQKAPQNPEPRLPGLAPSAPAAGPSASLPAAGLGPGLTLDVESHKVIHIQS